MCSACENMLSFTQARESNTDIEITIKNKCVCVCNFFLQQNIPQYFGEKILYNCL